MSDAYWEREVKAAKPHRCAEASHGGRCVRTAEIQKGTRYVRVSGVVDGSAWSMPMCLRCSRLLGKVWSRYMKHSHPEDGPAFGELRSWLRGVR